jgi:hypothetical protein
LTTAFWVILDTRITTVVEIELSAQAHTEANSMMAIHSAANLLNTLFMLNPPVTQPHL